MAANLTKIHVHFKSESQMIKSKGFQELGFQQTNMYIPQDTANSSFKSSGPQSVKSAPVDTT